MKRRYQGVTAYVGMPGSGKTYSLVQLAHRNFMSKNPLPVYTNAGFDLVGAEQFDSFHELVTLPGPALVLIDEAPIVFSSRRWAEFPDGVLYRLTQVRKDGLRVAWSGIHEDMADITLRRLTFFYWQCKSITSRFFVRTMWGPGEFRRQNERPMMREWVRVRTGVASLYDTSGKVAAPTRIADAVETTDKATFRRIEVVERSHLDVTSHLDVVDPANGSEVVADPWGDIPEAAPLGRGWADPAGLWRE